MALVEQTITPTNTDETFGDVISIDRIDSLDKVLMTFKNEIDQDVSVKVYGSNYNDETMVDSVLLTTIAMTVGSVTRTTASYFDDATYPFYRVSVTAASTPTGNFSASIYNKERL